LKQTPHAEYRRRLSHWESSVARLRKLEGRISSLRLGLALIFLILAWLGLVQKSLSLLWALVPAAAFAGAVLRHVSVGVERVRCERLVANYQRGLARIEDRWAGGGRTGESFADSHHVYSSDLDLFGKGSLFELLTVARTRVGEETLARWLRQPACVPELLDRQAGIRELRDRTDLRESIAGINLDGEIGVQHDALVAWAEAPAALTQRRLYPLSILSAGLGALGLSVWLILGFVTPLLLVLIFQGVVLYAVRKPLGKVLKGTETAFADLRFFSEILVCIEQGRLAEPALQSFVSRLSSHSMSASDVIAQLRLIDGLASSRRNMVVMLLGAPFMYTLHVALAAERWRRRHGSIVRTWVEATGHFEALSSLATYSYEHPADPFPQFIDEAPTFRADGLGHPLIPQARCVRNDVYVADAVRLLLVSGSNMSGKSTLLRAVGINVVLAMAGAPVRALCLQLTPLQIGASIRTNDSLQDGSSRFYAEITRLRRLFAAMDQPPPVLFLLDELLQGTNSHDRQIGAQGILKAFVERGAIGFATTHDLALTTLDGLPNGAVRNVHFEDELKDGVMTFDFKLREGIVTKSNGIELMRSIGLMV
jgi:hypothetical protein